MSRERGKGGRRDRDQTRGVPVESGVTAEARDDVEVEVYDAFEYDDASTGDPPPAATGAGGQEDELGAQWPDESTGQVPGETRAGSGSVWPERQVLSDGTEVITHASMHAPVEELNRAAHNGHAGTAPSFDRELPWGVLADAPSALQGSESVPDDDWLNDYEEGSTSEEVLRRLKSGMVISYVYDDADVIAAEAIRRANDRLNHPAAEGDAGCSDA